MSTRANAPSSTFQPRLCIVGPGRVGRTLALHHHRLRHSVVLLGRPHGDWQQWAAQHGMDCAIVDWEDQPCGQTDILLFCVDDDSLPAAVTDGSNWIRQRMQSDRPFLVAHTSGHVGLEVFAHLPQNAATSFAALHPAQPFTNPDAPLQPGIPVTAVFSDSSLAEPLVQSWQARWIPLPADVDRDRYHLAVSLAANHVTELLGRSEQLLQQAWGEEDVDRSAVRSIVHHLAKTAVDSFADHGAQQALTGPIVRGDLRTLQAHLPKVPAHQRLLQLHEWLAICELGAASGRLPRDSAERIRKWLQQQLSSASSA